MFKKIRKYINIQVVFIYDLFLMSQDPVIIICFLFINCIRTYIMFIVQYERNMAINNSTNEV